MGIPVPTKRAQDKPAPKYRSMPRGYMKRAEADDFVDNDVPNSLGNNVPVSNIPVNNVNPKEEFKQRGSEISRMGNYFNIVIAPPPIKALQPRKLLQSDSYRNAGKRMN